MPGERFSRTALICLLECYVLWAIDEVDEEQAEILAAMTPVLRSVYRASGDWPDVIAAAMHWPRNMPRKIRHAWTRSLMLRGGGSDTSARQFAEKFVYDNFVADVSGGTVPTSIAPRPTPVIVSPSD
jgi:hypothetical protein